MAFENPHPFLENPLFVLSRAVIHRHEETALIGDRPIVKWLSLGCELARCQFLSGRHYMHSRHDGMFGMPWLGYLAQYESVRRERDVQSLINAPVAIMPARRETEEALVIANQTRQPTHLGLQTTKCFHHLSKVPPTCLNKIQRC